LRGHAKCEGSQSWGAADLGTNLPENATSSSRMSPAGIPLFYGASNVETALAEVAQADSREFFTVGKFVTTEPMTVIDLTHIPTVPSIFDPELGSRQGQLLFLNELVDELRKPIDTARINLDYVPTQVFCEYFLHVFTPEGHADDGIDPNARTRGLAWTSAAAAGGGRCLALLIPQEDCVDTADMDDHRLRLHLVPGGTTVHRRRTDEFRQVRDA
jgi:RES domain